MSQTIFKASSSGEVLDATKVTGRAVMIGGGGDDILLGGAGADHLSGNGGQDQLNGNDGNDRFFTAISAKEADTIDGGEGTDSLYIALTSKQLAQSDVHEALAALTTFMKTGAAVPGGHFTNDVLHLDMTGVERAYLRLDGVVQPLDIQSTPVDPSTLVHESAVTVTAQNALYDYGTAVSGPDAKAPVSVDLGSGTGRVVTFTDVAGSFSYDETGDFVTGPDGFAFADGTHILPAAGLAGMDGPHAGMLVGVFLDGHEQDAGHVAPGTLDFRALGEDFETLSPGIDQPFFIGDGLTGNGSGSTQRFLVPDGAKVLKLGVADAGAFHGAQGAYDDNTGAVTAHVTVQDKGWHL